MPNMYKLNGVFSNAAVNFLPYYLYVNFVCNFVSNVYLFEQYAFLGNKYTEKNIEVELVDTIIVLFKCHSCVCV